MNFCPAVANELSPDLTTGGKNDQKIYVGSQRELKIPGGEGAALSGKARRLGAPRGANRDRVRQRPSGAKAKRLTSGRKSRRRSEKEPKARTRALEIFTSTELGPITRTSDPKQNGEKITAPTRSKGMIFPSKLNRITTDPQRPPSSLPHLIIETKIKIEFLSHSL
jgi:hypothetical protein